MWARRPQRSKPAGSSRVVAHHHAAGTLRRQRTTAKALVTTMGACVAARIENRAHARHFSTAGCSKGADSNPKVLTGGVLRRGRGGLLLGLSKSLFLLLDALLLVVGRTSLEKPSMIENRCWRPTPIDAED